MSTTGKEIEVLISASQTRGVWRKIQRWYEQAKGHPQTSTREILEHTSTLRDYLYIQYNLEGKAIPILVKLVKIFDRPLEG